MLQPKPTTEPPELGADRGQHSEAVPSDATKGLAAKGAVLVGIAAFVGVSVFGFGGSEKKAVTTEKVVIARGSAFEPAPPPPVPVPPKSEAPMQPLVAAVSPPMALAAATPKGPDLMDMARRAPVIAFSKTSPVLADNSRVLGYSQEDKPEDNGTFGKLLKPTTLEGARAGHLGNRDFVIAMGTSVPCVLETALSSDQPGFTTCVINRDVMSDNGRVALLEKGTQVIGEYRGGLKQGQQRLFVLWTRAKTPTGVIISLGSPASDALGRAGFDGQVDNHWMERFGSALLLSVVSDMSTIATTRLQTNGIQASNTGGSGKQAASIAVEQSGSILPTLTKHQGDLVNIILARDLDFTGVYKLRMLPPSQRATWTTAAVPVAVGDGDVFSAKILSLKD